MKIESLNGYKYIEDKKGEYKKTYVYHCHVCGKEITDYRPVRLVKQLYGYGPHKQYYSVRNYDFCKECYWALDDLLFKWKRKKKE